MKYSICQLVKIVDMNDELITEVTFDHGTLDTPNFSIGCSVVTSKLGLKEFTVVYDKRSGEVQRQRIVDIEYSLVEVPPMTRAFLEPVTLIVGQHDIGNV